jgi:hypothetical protein
LVKLLPLLLKASFGGAPLIFVAVLPAGIAPALGLLIPDGQT